MPVADNAPRNQYVATSGQTAFTYSFEILAQTDLVVLQEGVTLALTTDYTVSGVGDANGGTVTLVSGATADDEIVIYRDMAVERTTDYAAGGQLDPDVLDADLDRILLAVQQLERDISRSLRLGPADVFGTPETSFVLQDSQARANKALTFDATGTPSASAAITFSAGSDQVTSLAALRLVSTAGLVDGQIIHMTNYYEGIAGGGGPFWWGADSALDDNGGTVILPTGHSGAGRWLRVVTGSTVTIQQFGADGSGDDTTYIQAAVDAGYSTVLANDITCGLTTTLTIPANTHLTGDGTFNFTGTPEASTKAAIKLNGDYAAVSGLAINVTAGNYQRTVQLNDDYTKAQRLRVNVSTADITGGAAHYTFFSATATPFQGVEILDNDVQCSNVPIADGVQMSGHRGAKVLRNRFHDMQVSAPDSHYWGIYVSQDCMDVTVEGNVIETTDGGGIHVNALVGTPCRRVYVRGNTVKDVTYYGISLDEYTFDCSATENKVTGSSQAIFVAALGGRHYIGGNTLKDIDTAAASDAALIACSAPSCAIVGNVLDDRGTAIEGIHVEGAGCAIVGNTFGSTRPRVAIKLTSAATGCAIVGNTILASDDSTTGSVINVEAAACNIAANRVTNGTTAGWIGIRIAASNVVAQGNVISGSATGIFISSGTSNIIVNNQVTGQSGAAISDSGTTTRIRGNVGYVTENSGTGSIASGATTATITHGLSKTPAAANISIAFTEQGTNDYGRFWISGITSTQFTLNVSADPGASNLDFSWQASIL